MSNPIQQNLHSRFGTAAGCGLSLVLACLGTACHGGPAGAGKAQAAPQPAPEAAIAASAVATFDADPSLPEAGEALKHGSPAAVAADSGPSF